MAPTESIPDLLRPSLLRVHLEGGGERNGASIELTAIAEAVRTGLKEALADEDMLIDYAELARRMRLKEKFVRHLKNAGVIHAALDLGKIVRFHWPSVLTELKSARVNPRKVQ